MRTTDESGRSRKNVLDQWSIHNPLLRGIVRDEQCQRMTEVDKSHNCCLCCRCFQNNQLRRMKFI